MKKTIISLFFGLSILIVAQAQQNSPLFFAMNDTAELLDTERPDVSIIDSKAISQHPRYTGGRKSLQAFYVEKAHYTDLAMEHAMEGMVNVQFYVMPDGSLTKVQAIGPYKELEKMAITFALAMPAWQPGLQNGKPVKTKVVLPIHFSIR